MSDLCRRDNTGRRLCALGDCRKRLRFGDAVLCADHWKVMTPEQRREYGLVLAVFEADQRDAHLNYDAQMLALLARMAAVSR